MCKSYCAMCTNAFFDKSLVTVAKGRCIVKGGKVIDFLHREKCSYFSYCGDAALIRRAPYYADMAKRGFSLPKEQQKLIDKDKKDREKAAQQDAYFQANKHEHEHKRKRSVVGLLNTDTIIATKNRINVEEKAAVAKTLPGARPDKWFLAHQEVIQPFTPTTVSKIGKKKVVSYGVSSYGYDVRIGKEFLYAIPGMTIDPHREDVADVFEPVQCGNGAVKTLPYMIDNEAVVIPAHGFVLGSTVEYVKIPDDTIALCIGKSTYARCGLVVNTTPIEPGWEGHITIELSNTTDSPIVVYCDEGIAQLVFIGGSGECETTYSARNGKYNKQANKPVPARL